MLAKILFVTIVYAPGTSYCFESEYLHPSDQLKIDGTLNTCSWMLYPGRKDAYIVVCSTSSRPFYFIPGWNSCEEFLEKTGILPKEEKLKLPPNITKGE